MTADKLFEEYKKLPVRESIKFHKLLVLKKEQTEFENFRKRLELAHYAMETMGDSGLSVEWVKENVLKV